MSTASVDPLLPQPPGGLREGAALAAAAHAALVAALVWGLNWRAQAPETVSAELWAAVPQMAAPKLEEAPAPPPPPAPVAREAPPPPKAVPQPPDAQIAIERERREKKERDERERLEQQKQREREAREKRELQAQKERQEKEAREKKERQEREAAEAKLAKAREENLKRMMGQIGATGNPSATGTAQHDAAPSRSYAGRLVAHIKPNIVFTDTVSGNPAAEVEVRAAPSGTIVARRLVKSSGNKDWDEAVLRAIDRTGTLPKDIDGRVPGTLLIAFRPND